MKDNKSKFENQAKKKKDTIKYIRLYVIPIFAVSFFIGILIFLTIPKINEIITSLDTISANNATIAQNTADLAKLDSLSSQYNTIVQNLGVIDGIAPLGSTEVVKFRDRITNLIQSNNITIISQRLSEANTQPDSQDTQTQSPIILQEVPFIFTITGSYTNIVKFIQDLNTVEDFIVIKEMELAGSGNEDQGDWQMKINIVKYQFNTDTNADLRKLFMNVPIDAELNTLLQQYIRARSTSSSSSSTTLPTVTVPSN